MTAEALRSTLAARGVRLALVGGRVRVTAPAGTLTTEDRAALHEHRDALLALLLEETALEVFAGATVDPTAGAERTGEWPSRYGAIPPDFDRLVPARAWLATATPAPKAAK
jgi:hypothetical protein